MIAIKDLTFKYRKKEKLFKELSLQLKPGNIYGLLGKNGAGKTTLLKIMSGMLYANSGECTLNGINTNKRFPQTYQDIFFIPEEFELPKLSIAQFAKIHSPFYPNFSELQFNQYIADFKLDLNENLKNLSYGQVKMVIISFGLAVNTKYLVLDEPTNALDIPSKALLRKMLSNAISDERSFIVSTHQVRDLESIIDPIVIIDEGKIVMNNSIDELMLAYTFKQTQTINNNDVVYAEERLGNYSTICKNNNNESSKINIELLFNGVTNTPERFSNSLTTNQ